MNCSVKIVEEMPPTVQRVLRHYHHQLQHMAEEKKKNNRCIFSVNLEITCVKRAIDSTRDFDVCKTRQTIYETADMKGSHSLLSEHTLSKSYGESQFD